MKKEEKVERVHTKPKKTNQYDQEYEKELKRKERLLDEMYLTSNNYSHTRSQTKFCGHKWHDILSNTCCICSS